MRKGMSDLEGTVGYSLPKICVLFPMAVGSPVSLMIRKLMNGTYIYNRFERWLPIPYLLPAFRGTFLKCR